MLLQSANDFLGRIVPIFCDGDFTVAALMGLTRNQFVLAKAAVFIAAFVTLSTFLYAARRRFNRNGFTNEVWRACFWLLSAISLFQVLNILSVAVWGQSIVCPYDTMVSSFALFMGLYAVWFFHLGQGNKGRFPTYFSLVVLPLFGDIALNARQATITGVRGAVALAEFGLRLFGHVAAHV